MGPDTDVSSEDPDCVARRRERLELALNLVRDLGKTMLCGVNYSGLTKYSHPLIEWGIRNSQPF